MTFWQKVVFPLVWISATPLFFLAAVHRVPAQTDVMFLAGWIAGAIFIVWTCAGLKRVRIDSRLLHVSNYLREIAIPFDDIVDVTQNRWINIRPVTIHLRNATEFGSEITFMPRHDMLFWKMSPVVAELKALAGLEHP
jgi:hypothetical protein